MLSRGFTLIEVLVTLVILVFGLLGIAGLMAKGQRASYEAYQRQAALAIANDMAERMRANRAQAPAYATGAPVLTPPVGAGTLYSQLLVGPTTNCGTVAAPAGCSGAELVAYDLALWDGLMRGYGERVTAGGNLVGGVLNAIGCIEDITPAPAACPVPPPPVAPGTTVDRVYRVSIAWQGNDDTVDPGAVSACGDGQYSTAARRRLVSLDLFLPQPCP